MIFAWDILLNLPIVIARMIIILQKKIAHPKLDDTVPHIPRNFWAFSAFPRIFTFQPYFHPDFEEGVVGLAFSEPLDAALRLSVVKMGPSLEVPISGCMGRCFFVEKNREGNPLVPSVSSVASDISLTGFQIRFESYLYILG